MPATSKSLCAPLLESMVSGVPGILLAATPATATLTSGAGTLALSAAHPGNIPLGLKLVQSPGANAALSVVDGTGLVTVNLATDSGNAGSAVIANGSVVTLKKILSIIPVGIWFALHHEDSLWMESEVYPTPLYPLRQAGVYQSGIYNGFDATGYLLVELGTNAGSPAYVTVAGDTGSYTLGATAGSPGVWPHGKVRIRHIGSVSEYNPDELAKEMSFVSTEIVMVANLTVREMVGLGRFPYTNWFGQLGAEDHRIIEKAIHQVGLSGYENRLINRISDGERQRAMVARALAQDTRIIILDEPTAFLDISNKYEIVRILHNLAKEQGKCIIFSTHELNTALSMADRIWLMLNDSVIDGIPEEVAYGGYFESLFSNNPHLYFDPEKNDFRIRKENLGTIFLTATGNELIWATKALERLGYEVNSTFLVREMIEIEVKQLDRRWQVGCSGKFTVVESLGELCREVKKIKLQP